MVINLNKNNNSSLLMKKFYKLYNYFSISLLQLIFLKALRKKI